MVDTHSIDVLRPAFAPGEILASRFRVVGFIGRGGMAEICEADNQEVRGVPSSTRSR